MAAPEDVMKDVTDGVTKNVTGVFDFAKGTGEGIFDGAKTAGEGIFNQAKDMGTATIDGTYAKNLVDGSKTMVTDPVKGMTDIKDLAQDSVTKGVTQATDMGKGAFDSTVSIGTKATEGITDSVKSTVDVAKKTTEMGVEQAKKGVDVATGFAGDAYKMTTEQATALMGGFGDTFDKLGVNKGFQAVMSLGGEVDTSDAALEAQFASIDADSSGKVSTEEMKAFITKFYGQELDPALVDKMMGAADTNNDGEVDLAEFKVIMRAGPEKVATAPDLIEKFTCGALGRGCVKVR